MGPAALNKVRQKAAFHRAQKRDVALEERGAYDADSEDTAPAGLYSSVCSLDPSPSENAIGHEEAERIERAMDKLPEDHREVILLARIVGLSHREIAARLGRAGANLSLDGR